MALEIHGSAATLPSAFASVAHAVTQTCAETGADGQLASHVGSGLHSLRAGEIPRWSADEGLSQGTAECPTQAHWSRKRAPNTIHCLTGQIPAGY